MNLHFLCSAATRLKCGENVYRSYISNFFGTLSVK